MYGTGIGYQSCKKHVVVTNKIDVPVLQAFIYDLVHPGIVHTKKL
jgi:hypothetical protein